MLPTAYREQPNFFYCGPTAVSIALSTKVTPPNLDTLAAELGTTDNGTNFDSVSPVLTNRLAGAAYRDQRMAGTTVSDTVARTLRVADPAGSTLTASLPSHHWLTPKQVATYCAGRGYFW